MPESTSPCACGHPFEEHTEFDDVPCEGSLFVAPGSFVECECQGFTAARPVPNFDACHACGADAKENAVWDDGDGWTCRACGATDGDA